MLPSHELACTDRPSTRNLTLISTRVALQAELGKVLATHRPLRETLQACAEMIVRDTDVALTRIWVFHAGLSELMASAGLIVFRDDARAQVPIGQFTIGHIAQTRRPLVTNHIMDCPFIHDKEWSRREGLTAFAGIPLLIDNELEGVLAMYDHRPIPAPVIDALTAAARDIALAVKPHRVEIHREQSGSSFINPHNLSTHSEHAVIATTLEGAITAWNPAAERFFGHRYEEVRGAPIAILVPPELADEDRDVMKRAALGETVFCPAMARLCKGGQRMDVRFTVSPLRDPAGKPSGITFVADDIAEFKRLEHQVTQAQKMEVFGQLAGGVAHDFNNLLTVILGYSEIIINRMTADDPVRELLGEIHKAGQRAETLTRQLLAFSRKSILEPKVLDVNAVISDTEKMLRRLIGEDILVTTIFAPALKMVKVDSGQLQQVILNLAVNARDAMPRGGRLTIETDNVILDESYTQNHPEVRSGPYVLFAISDSGVGMNLATKARIFEPLFTTKEPGKGTGLGLSTVHSIIKQYGGHIEVYSELGYGSTFKVYLPQVQEPLPIGKSHPHLQIIPRGKETILLVEDEDAVRFLARQVLEICGYTVLEAANGEDAVRLVESHDRPIDLLVSDVVMPYLGGRLLADRLLALKPRLKVLFLSGYTHDAVVRHGVSDSEFAFLQKPFTTRGLAQKVRDVLDLPVES